MKATDTNICKSEHDFALVVSGVPELNQGIEDALYNAGCDDATLSIQYGQLYVEFSREAASLEAAILSAIRDIWKANIDAEVVRVDECNLVTPAEIARKIGRSRQLVFQYMTSERGPGRFPAPACNLAEGKPLWYWCEVSYWLVQNNLLRPEAGWNADVVAAINAWIESNIQRERHPELVKLIEESLQASAQ
jgi:hypothetical protein